MQAIITFFEGLGSAIQSIFDFVITMFQDLAFMVKLLGKFLGAIPTYFGWLPSAVLTSLTLILAIVVIYKILGREG